jgi:transcriptional regulator with XRE-family HTH domain
MQERDPTRHALHRRWLVALGQHISVLRSKHKFSQVGFAIRAGFARAYYSSIERGERNVSAINLIRLAQALGVEVGELFPPLANLRGLGAAEGEDRKDTQEEPTTDELEPHLMSRDKTAALVSAGAAARLLGVNRRTIERWVGVGSLTPAARVEDQQGKRYSVFWPEDIDRLVRARKKE